MIYNFTEQQEKKTKPKLENLIPQYLDGDMKKIALDFIAYMRENKMAPSYRPSLRYKCNYKGKGICTISLPRMFPNPNPYSDNEFGQPWMENDIDIHKNNWVVIPQLDNFSEYETQIDEDMRNIICNPKNMYHCNGCWMSNANFPEPRDMCGPRPVRTLFGKEFHGLCGRGFFWFYNPNEAEIDCVKKLLEFEIKARI